MGHSAAEDSCAQVPMPLFYAPWLFQYDGLPFHLNYQDRRYEKRKKEKTKSRVSNEESSISGTDLIAGEVIFVVCCLRGHNSLLPKHNILYTGAHENFSTCQKACPHAKKMKIGLKRLLRKRADISG
jgi:hypothetical protein